MRLKLVTIENTYGMSQTDKTEELSGDNIHHPILHKRILHFVYSIDFMIFTVNNGCLL